jgi:hypothetical protein
MKVRRVLADVRWAFRETVTENELDIHRGDFKRLCDHCVMINSHKCPRKKQLQPRTQAMIATRCVFFIATR